MGAWFEYLLLRTRVRVVFGRTRLGGPHARGIAAGAGVAVAAAVAVRGPASALPVRLGGMVAVLVVGAAYLVTTRLLHVPEAGELTGRITRLVRR